MRKSLLIAASNLRKSKGQAVTIVVLMLLAATLFNLWLMLSMDYTANFDRYHEKLNAEHALLAADNDAQEFKDFVTRTLNEDGRTSEFALDDCMHMVSTYAYNGGEINSEVIILSETVARERKVGAVEFLESGEPESGIYVPYICKSDEISIGSKYNMTIGSGKVSYTVRGFINSIMAGSHNCAMCMFVLTDDKYEELQALGYAPTATLCSVRIKDKADSEDFAASFKTSIEEVYPNIRTVSNSYALVVQSRYVSQMICSSIMSATAFLVLLIAIVVIVSNIANHIRENMPSIGALKAVGYTTKQLITSLLVQFLLLALCATVVGIALSYALFPAINSMMIAQTGIPYAVHFLPIPAVIALVSLCGAVTLATVLSALKIKKIEPITALRSGVRTHNFKRNRIPLEKTKLPINAALALKTTLSNVKQNITVCVTMLVLSLVVVFTGVVTENMLVDMTPFLNLLVGETADCCINVQSEREQDLVNALGADSRVENEYLFTSTIVRHMSGVELQANIGSDFSEINNQNIIYQGRFPKYDNEIAIGGKYALDNGFKVGDEIEIGALGKTFTYLITGFTQMYNMLGKDCMLTRDGFENLGELTNVSYYINLSSSVDVDAFNGEYEELFGSDINTTININSLVDVATSGYVSLMTMIVIAVIILSLIIITFVLYLLVKTMLANKKRDYGILKALGYTTGQLTLQTALSFMPSIILSSVIGLIASSFAINPLLSLFLGSIGIVKCAFIVPVPFIVISGFALIALSFGIACLLSLRVKKPRALLVGE